MRTLVTKVAGVTYENRQDYLITLRGTEPCRIVPEPDNPYDENALAVHIATTDGVKHCGFIPRYLAAEIAPHLEGESVMASIREITGGFEKRDGTRASLGLIIGVELPDAEDDRVTDEDESVVRIRAGHSIKLPEDLDTDPGNEAELDSQGGWDVWEDPE